MFRVFELLVNKNRNIEKCYGTNRLQFYFSESRKIRFPVRIQSKSNDIKSFSISVKKGFKK